MSNQCYKVCFCFQRRFKHSGPEPPAEVKSLFDRYSENGLMGVDHLYRFLVEVQKEESATRDYAQTVVDIYNRKGLTLEAFFQYIFGDTNPPLDPSRKVHHDMKAPLSQYYIFTGHNSYLTGNQLNSDCSDAPIIEALQGGVRVIELDIWPNSSKDDIHVLHGGTLTEPVEFIKCLRSIKEHAFTVSEYPLIITLEDHLTPDLQAKAAQMLTETFGNVLFTPDSQCFKELPSPESLKNRIMISTKPPKESLQAKDSKEKAINSKERDAGDEDVGAKDNSPKGDVMSKKPVAPEYKRLIAIRAGKPKGDLADSLRLDPDKVRRLSLSEAQLKKVAEDHGKELIRFTQRNMLRIYPKGTRVDSSNYNPLTGWMHGAQMVAFNMQGHGRDLWVMQGMFKANGGCGYLKKPDFLLKAGSDDVFYDPKAKIPVKTTLKVTLYMGEGWHCDFKQTHFDSFSPPDFYTKLGIVGVRKDSVMKRTKSSEDDWIPKWNEQFEFPLTCPELAVFRIEVRENDVSEKDDFGGQTCLPVSELKPGIRAVPLYDKKGEKYDSVKLLISFEFIT